MKSKQGRKELIKYIQSPNPLIILVIISSEFDLRNSFLDKIAKNSELLDLRTPFKEKMQEWVRYIINSRNINITEAIKLWRSGVDCIFIDNPISYIPYKKIIENLK